jgi:hypothetical protein
MTHKNAKATRVKLTHLPKLQLVVDPYFQVLAQINLTKSSCLHPKLEHTRVNIMSAVFLPQATKIEQCA